MLCESHAYAVHNEMRILCHTHAFCKCQWQSNLISWFLSFRWISFIILSWFTVIKSFCLLFVKNFLAVPYHMSFFYTFTVVFFWLCVWMWFSCSYMDINSVKTFTPVQINCWWYIWEILYLILNWKKFYLYILICHFDNTHNLIYMYKDYVNLSKLFYSNSNN